MISRPVVVVLLFVAACDSAQRYSTTVEILDIETFGDPREKAAQINFELRYADCPGDNRRILRGDKDLAQCAKAMKEGDKLKVDVVSTWSSERGFYRSEVVKLGDCVVKQDPKDEANYEIVQVCTDVKTTGAVVGVRCDRSRPKSLIEKCPFLRRK